MQPHIDGQLHVRFIPVGDEDWVEYTFQNQSKDMVLRKVEEKDIARYPQLWSTYEAARRKIPIDGTPLDAMPGMTQERVIGLRIKGVQTIERLAAFDDLEAGGLGPDGVGLRDIAKLYLAANPASPKVKIAPKAA